MSKRTAALLALALLVVLSTVEATTFLPETCSGGGAFGLYRRQTGCAFGNCKCFPFLFECDATLGDGLGQCVLSSAGWMVLIGAFALNLVVPLTAFVRHLFHKSSAAKITGREDHVETDLERDGAGRKYMINLNQFRSIVPDTVFGLDQAPKIFMETMNKGWVQLLCYSVLGAFVLSLAMLIPPFTMEESLYPLTRDTTIQLNRSAYRIASHANTSIPPGIRYVSVQGDFCGNAPTLLAPNDKTLLNVTYQLSFKVEGRVMFDKMYGHKTIGCVCANAVCHVDDAQSDDGYVPLVYFPWYQDALNPLDLHEQPHGFQLSGTFQLRSKFNPNGLVEPIPHLAFIAHHSYIERVTTYADLAVFLGDVLAFLLWICLTRKADFLPERRLMYVILAVNFLGSFPVLFVAQKLDPTASWQDTYFFTHAWTACSNGLWLLCLLFALDMQRKRIFGCRFYMVKLLLGAVVLVGYMALFYSSLPVQWVQLANFFLAILATSIFSGVMVDVRNKLRYESYADSRPQQLTARFLYSVSMAVTYTFFFAALFADPVPRVTNYLPKTVILTDLSLQIVVRGATWALVLIFLPPKLVEPNVFYTRAHSALPRLGAAASQKDFELAHLKQAVKSYSTTTRNAAAADAWRAPHAFCLETACAMYNQSVGVYDEPILNKATGKYEMASLDHFTQDGLRFVSEVFDPKTDTYGWVSRGDKKIVVTFRGTQSAANTVTDLMYRFAVPTWENNDEELEKTRVHVGFWTAYSTIRHDLKRILRDTIASMPTSDVQIYFTGHSLGGALATVAAFDIATDQSFRLTEEVVMYSFGAPRVGNHAFAKAYKKYAPNAFRVCNDGDAIVGAPKRSVQLAYCLKHLNYKHVGRAVLLSTRAQGVFVIEPNIVEMAFMAEFRYNALAHLGGGYQTMLEKGIKYAINPKKNTLYDPEGRPLLQ
ncbi:Aste57867_14179 [Aphanomyces stellatus]|uniref:Aste57867_14179 protein n=1 Tax=Aphanomyces stellatus TaxID=120398 RepID=A0A485KZZ7_9STRA|nr:hypothetical protein As57867_014128 [Aphanomyces stellatus]VFT91004.1 Aste57867_14179 [Aphanomyces stellatus]